MSSYSKLVCVASVLAAALLAGGCYHVEAPEEPEEPFEWDCDTLSEGQIHVRIHIDGRSWLLIQGDELWLQHFDYAAPGRHEGANHPTVIDGEEWYPEWPFGPPPDEGRDCGGCETLDRYYLDEQIPISGEVMVELEAVKGRGETTLIEAQTAAFDNTIVVEFDDNPQSSSVWYEIILRYATCAERSERTLAS
ncbi:MAG: hypothetical protein JRF63_06485 [Deltaproteobacteria bacterium]|nr:hypothetical protein [Deltaproteobacteria bacterium]